MGARRGGGNSRRADDYMREENGYHHGPPESEMNQQDYNQHPNRQDGRDFQQRVNSYENGRRWKRQDDRRGSHRATEGEKVADVASSDMRGRISAQLARGVAECLVCLDRVKQVTPTWDCHSCFQVNFTYVGVTSYIFPGIPPELHQEMGEVSSGDKWRLEVPRMSGGEQRGAH